MSAPDTLLYRIALTMIPGVGDVTARKILRIIPEPELLFTEKREQLLKAGIPDKLLSCLSKDILLKAEKELSFVLDRGIAIHFLTDASYPWRLRDIEDAPVLLYAAPHIDLNPVRTIGIVGTRKATSYGHELTRALVKDISQYSPVVVSGLALGIDICAHREALSNQLVTIGIPGHGLDRIYPYAHRNISEEMTRNGGGLLTEFPSGTRPDKENFPRRNRIIAALSDALVVVEAGEKGGALITAGIAFSYNREVFAFPGRVTDPSSIGCNRLISSNIASSVENGEGIAWNLGWTGKKTAQEIPEATLFNDLSPEEKLIVESLKQRTPKSLDILSLETSLPVDRTSGILLELEFSGKVKSLPGKMYQLSL